MTEKTRPDIDGSPDMPPLANRVSLLEQEVRALKSELAQLRAHTLLSTAPETPLQSPEIRIAQPFAATNPDFAPKIEEATWDQAPLPTAHGDTVPEAAAELQISPKYQQTFKVDQPFEPLPPSLAERAFGAARDWLLGGNSVVRVGILILFFGVAFLLKYAADNDMLPMEFRVAGVCAGAMALLVLGWRLREKRANYALSLQGAGVGVLYLTVFAATKLYNLVPALAAFPLLVAICALAAGLAILQTAMVLAFTGSAGGFLAPILISSGGGSHVGLFSYYALLNAGIFAIAWYKAWRPLNLLGFVFTFGIATAWGVLRYEPQLLWSTEPFLILFFLMYTAIAMLYAMRRQINLKHYIDGTLLFGTPLATMGLQAALMQDIPFGIAFSAAAMAALYLGLAIWLVRYRERFNLLFESMLALGAIFATLAVPLAFDGQTTSAVWAVEGAALVWLSVRQQHRNGMFCGVLLQFAAGAMFAFGSLQDLTPITLSFLNSRYVGTLLLGLSGAFCGWQLHGRREARDWYPLSEQIGLIAAIWGLAWWIGGGVSEVIYWRLVHSTHNLFSAPEQRALLASLATFAVLTAWLTHFARRALIWPLAERPALALAPVLSALILRSCTLTMPSPLLGLDLVFWMAAIGITYLLLWRQQKDWSDGLLGWMHTLLFLTICIVLATEGYWRLHAYVPEGAWSWSVWACGYGILLAALSTWGWKISWPIMRFQRAYLWWGAIPLALLLWLWSLASIISDGAAVPLPYLPLLNPLDITQLIAILALGLWWQRLRMLRLGFPAFMARHAPVIGYTALATLFMWLNAVLLRTLHHHFNVAYDIAEVLHSLNLQLIFMASWGALILAVVYRAHNERLQRFFLFAAAPLVLVMWLWTFAANLTQSGTLLGRIPLLNPLDLVLMLVYGVAIFWLMRAPRLGISIQPHIKAIKTIAGATMVLWLNAMLLRTLHHWADIPYTLSALGGSTLVQASLSVFWTVLALIIMVIATRRSMRPLWLVGGALLAVIVVKLFLVDLSFVKGIERIFSFIGVGLLLLLIGYVSPLPPKAKEAV